MLNSALIIFSIHLPAVNGYAVNKRSKSFVHTGEFYGHLLLDTVEKFSRVPYAAPIVFAADADEASTVSSAFPTLRVSIQAGESRRERIRGAIEDTFGEGYRQVVLVLSTTATIPHRIPECAFTLLDTLEDVVVLAPTTQGGYYLLGLRHPHEEVLSVVDFDDPDLYERTIRALPATETALYLLHTWRDLRSIEDVHELWTQIQFYPITRDILPRTSSFLDHHASQLFPSGISV